MSRAAQRFPSIGSGVLERGSDYLDVLSSPTGSGDTGNHCRMRFCGQSTWM